jgi:hypothetical protein
MKYFIGLKKYFLVPSILVVLSWIVLFGWRIVDGYFSKEITIAVIAITVVFLLIYTGYFLIIRHDKNKW